MDRVDVRITFVSGDRAVLIYDFVCRQPIGVSSTAEMVRFQDGFIREYRKASMVADHSMLPPFFQWVLKGLWLSDLPSSLTIALALACIAANPRLAATPLVLLLALMRLAMAVVVFLTMGSFFAA